MRNTLTDLLKKKDEIIRKAQENFDASQMIISAQNSYIGDLERRLVTYRENFASKQAQELEHHEVLCRDCGAELKIEVEWNDGIGCSFLNGDFHCVECVEVARIVSLAEDAADIKLRVEKEDAR